MHLHTERRQYAKKLLALSILRRIWVAELRENPTNPGVFFFKGHAFTVSLSFIAVPNDSDSVCTFLQHSEGRLGIIRILTFAVNFLSIHCYRTCCFRTCICVPVWFFLIFFLFFLSLHQMFEAVQKYSHAISSVFLLKFEPLYLFFTNSPPYGRTKKTKS